jgi:cephalosporin hydroxylase
MSSLREYYFNDLEKSSDKWESYFEIYDDHVSNSLYRLIDKQAQPRKFTFVEVGVQKGGSLEMWGKFFQDEQSCSQNSDMAFDIEIIGIDVDPECANLKYSMPNIQVIIGDQGDPSFWDKFLRDHSKIDIFIDDGGHFMEQQITTFERVFPSLSIGGVYICEDCHTSYMPYNGGGYKNPKSFIEYAKEYIDVVNSEWIMDNDKELNVKKFFGRDLTSVHFYDSMVVFEKFGKKEMKRVFPEKFRTS